MIRVRPLSPDACTAAYLAPFLKRHGRLSEFQIPGLARILAAGTALAAYEFLDDGKPAGYVIVNVRRHILADVRFGPVVLEDAHYLPCVAALRRVLRKRGVLLLRLFPPLGAPRPEGFPARLNWATSVVDLSRSEADILQSFSPNHRQSIRKAAAADIRVQEIGEDGLADYARGHVGMFARRGIAKDPGGTLRMVQGFHAHPADAASEVFMLSARQGAGGRPIGGGIFLRSGDTCMYYQGYAERLDVPLPVLHIVLWEAMKRARSLGCTRFDLTGYALDDDPQLKAVNDFKRWFRGAILAYPPTTVIPLYGLLRPLLRLIGQRI